MFEKTQKLIEEIYGVDSGCNVVDYLIDTENYFKVIGNTEDQSLSKRAESLVIYENDDSDITLGLYIDESVLVRLASSKKKGLTWENISDYCLMVEGISHFIHFIWRVNNQIPTTLLELEMQAEVDKFVICYLQLKGKNSFDTSYKLRNILFNQFHYYDNMKENDKGRYQQANDLGHSYCAFLEEKYIKNGKLQEMVEHLRRFYRLWQSDKIKLIKQVKFAA